MAVEITQEEMNILNLNGLTADDVKDNVEYMRASGYDDEAIRRSYDDTLEELRPITKTSVYDRQNINQWNEKGAITPYEYAQRKSFEYNGDYENIQKRKLSPREIEIQKRIENDRQNKLERNKRVNEGTASFIDRAGAFLDRMGDGAYQDSKQSAVVNEYKQMPKADNPNFKYELNGFNRAGQAQYSEVDKSKPIGFVESLRQSILSGSWTPYVGGFIKGADDAKERDIRQRILNGKEVRQDEIDFLNYRLDRKNEENYRGYTIGGQIADSFLPSLFRLGGEMATGGWVVKSLGLLPELAEGATIGAKVGHAVKNMLYGGALTTALPTSWNEIYSFYQDRRNKQELKLTDTGAWLFKEAEEKPAISFLKSLGTTFAMFAAEGGGELLGLGMRGVGSAASKYVGNPISAYLMKNAKLKGLYDAIVPAMAKAYEKMSNLPVVGKNTDWLKKAVKYDGLLEEMGEESLEDVLNLTLGTGDDERSFKNYIKAVFKSPDEWAVIAGAVILQGGILSATSSLLGSHLERNGMNDEEIIDTLNNLTPEEQREEVEKMIDEGIINIPEISDESKRQQIAEEIFKRLENNGKFKDDKQKKNVADWASLLVSSAAEKLNKSVEDIIENELPSVQYEGDNNTTLQGRVVYNQAAMRRSSFANFDNFYNNVISNRTSPEKEQFNYHSDDGINIRIPHDTVIHDDNKHNLSSDDWKDLLSNIDNVSSAELSKQKSSYNGKPVLLKINTDNNCYGVVLETFPKNNPIISTAFTDEEQNIDNWIKNEAVSSGTKTSFLNIRLNNIIANVQPNYKSKIIQNNQLDYQKQVDERLMNEFDMTSDEITTNVKADIQNILQQYDVSENEFNLEDVRVYGSYTTGQNKETSDIDFIVQYSGSMREDDAFNMLHDEGLTLLDKNGVERVVDINPINRATSGTIDEHLGESYYQAQQRNVIDWTDKFDKVPSFEEIEKHIKEIIASGQVFDTLSPEWKIDIKGGNRVVDKITNKGNFQKLKMSPKKRHNKYVQGIEELINNSVYSHSSKNDKPKEKPNILNYHYFDVNVKIGDKTYWVRLECEENKNAPKGDYAKRSKNSSRSNNSVEQNNKEVKTVHLYNIKEMRANKSLYQDEQGNFFRNGVEGKQNFNPDTINTLYKGEYVPFNRVIKIFESGDESTIIHEFAHWYLDTLDKYSDENEEVAQDMDAVRKFLKNDGGKFTVAQHEKFARAFEVYIRNGYAPNNRLKNVFEYFKNALLSIYDNLRQIVWKDEFNNDKTFTADDVPLITELFDKLMTSERERIKSKVFDKVAEINAQIEDIKNNEEAELEDLNKLYREYQQKVRAESAKKDKIDEYLALAVKQAAKKTKEQKEKEKRFRNTVYEILEAATGLKRQVIANPRNWELVDKKLEADDRITAGNGFQKEWGEFFHDTGMSYDTEELYGEQELTYHVFDILKSGDFSVTDNIDEIELGSDLFNWVRQVEYLSAKCLELKGEERLICAEALGELYANDMKLNSLPDVMKEVIADNFLSIVEKVDVKAREDFNKKSYPNIEIVKYMQALISDKLKNLKLYNPETRYKTKLTKSHKLYRLIAGVTSVDSAKGAIKKINESIIDDLRMNQKTLLHKEIQKQVNTKTRIKGGAKYKGKFDWETNTVFAELQEMNKKKNKQLRAMYLANLQLDKVAEGEARTSMPDENPSTLETNSFSEKLKRKFACYKAIPLKYQERQLLESILNDLLKLKRIGREAKDLEECNKLLHKDLTKKNLTEILEKHQNNNFAKWIAEWAMGVNPITSEGALANWETILTTLFDKDTANEFSLLKLESDAEVYGFNVSTEFFRKAKKIYNLSTEPKNDIFDKAKKGIMKFTDIQELYPLINLLKEYDKEIYHFKEVTWNQKGQFIELDKELSRSQIITIYAWFMNEGLQKRLINQFGIEQIQEMFSYLSEEDKDFAWLMIDTCDSLYRDINRVFINMTGLTLPKVENYFPSKAVRNCSEIDLMHDFIVRSSDPSYIKTRANCSRIKMDPQKPLDILLPHLNKVSRHVVMSETLNQYTQIFKGDTVVSAKIKEIYGDKAGDKILRVLATQLDSSVYSNYARGVNIGKSWLDEIASNFVTSSVGGNFKVMYAQLLSVINYAENMPADIWAKGFKDAIANPKSTVKFMWENCRYLQSRLSGNSMNEVMVRVTSETDKFRTIRQFFMSNTKYGDIAAIMFGGKPYVDYLMSQGMKQEDAFDKFVEATLRAQQSGHTSATSLWQKNIANHPITRILAAFNNTNLQYARKWIEACSNYAKGDITSEQFMKAAFIYKVMNPVMFTSFIGNLAILQFFNSVAGGGDDDNPVLTLLGDSAIAIVSSLFGGIGFIGMGITEIIRWGISALTHDRWYSPSNDFYKSLQKLAKKEIEFADYVEIMAQIGKYTTGVPMERLVDEAHGLYDISQGDVLKGVTELQGWSDYRTSKALGYKK